MRKGKPSETSLLLRLCFLLMAIVFLSNNVVQPVYDYLNLDSTELINDVDEEKAEKEKEGTDTDDYITDLNQYLSYTNVLQAMKPQSNEQSSHYYMDISTPPPERR